MSKGHVLITGGAGFIGSHLVDDLIAAGYRVRILDAFLPQVHPDGAPAYLNERAEVRTGDVRDRAVVAAALDDVDVIVHFAAAVGVGQSMYEVVHYSSVNVLGTATLLECLVKEKRRPRRLLVASSMSIYGEGLYDCYKCGPQSPGLRRASQLAQQSWEMRCHTCGASMRPVPTPESKPLFPTSVYAVNKRDQEELVLSVARSIGVPAIALRFFNVYGERQTLSNPYTGVVAIFSNAIKAGRRPIVFEDGLQSRDFIHVKDVVHACRLAIERDDVGDVALNVGTGRPTSLFDLLALLRDVFSEDKSLSPEITGRFREGDIRSCYADMSRGQELLGFEARIGLEDGLRQLAQWVSRQTTTDRSGEALAELERFRLVR